MARVKGEEMRVGGCKPSPSSGRGSGGSRKTLALASCKVFKGAGGVRGTARDTTVSRGVTTPITPQPASSTTPTGHFELNCGFPYFKLFVLA